MTTGTKLNKRDDRFARLMADANDAPGFCYAKSRDREYKGFNDDFQADKLLKKNDIIQAVSTYKRHILARDVLSRQEALVTLTRVFRAPSAPEIHKEMHRINASRADPEIKAQQLSALDMTGVKKIKTTKYGVEMTGYDLDLLAARILTLAGVDISKPITDEGKRAARATLTEIYRDMDNE